MADLERLIEKYDADKWFRLKTKLKNLKKKAIRTIVPLSYVGLCALALHYTYSDSFTSNTNKEKNNPEIVTENSIIGHKKSYCSKYGCNKGEIYFQNEEVFEDVNKIINKADLGEGDIVESINRDYISINMNDSELFRLIEEDNLETLNSESTINNKDRFSIYILKKDGKEFYKLNSESDIAFNPVWLNKDKSIKFKEHTGINVENLTREEIIEQIKEKNLDKIPYIDDNETKGQIVQELFEQYVEENLDGPVFVIDHPKESTPLCKGHRNCLELIERFEPFAAGFEIGNAYSELNDPILQRTLLEEQAKQLKGGDEEAHPLDEAFIKAIEYGMPPTGGLGLGIDRLVMLLTGNESIRDVIAFPFMKNED